METDYEVKFNPSVFFLKISRRIRSEIGTDYTVKSNPFVFLLKMHKN